MTETTKDYIVRATAAGDTVRAQRWLIDEMERKCEITFEYGHQDKE